MYFRIFEPRHEKTCFCHMRTTKAQISLKGADHLCCLDGIIPLVSISKISSLYLASVAAQAGLCLTWSETPRTGFSRDEAHLVSVVTARDFLRLKSHKLFQ